jgi:hypothetical protein
VYVWAWPFVAPRLLGVVCAADLLSLLMMLLMLLVLLVLLAGAKDWDAGMTSLQQLLYPGYSYPACGSPGSPGGWRCGASAEGQCRGRCRGGAGRRTRGAEGSGAGCSQRTAFELLNPGAWPTSPRRPLSHTPLYSSRRRLS